MGGALLGAFGFVGALVGMAAALLVVLLATAAALSGDLGDQRRRSKFTSLLSKSPEINWLSAARLFLFASRDVWFVVGLARVSQPARVVTYISRSISRAVGDRLRTRSGGSSGDASSSWNETVDGSAARLVGFCARAGPGRSGLGVACRRRSEPRL